MTIFVAETIGTALLVLLGCGVCANTSLSKSNGKDAGWLTVNVGWGLAVAICVYFTNKASGGHLNPAVTLGMASIGKLAWGKVPIYLGAQFLGALIGSVLVWLTYFSHWAATEDQDTKLGVFCTSPAIPATVPNLMLSLIHISEPTRPY